MSRWDFTMPYRLMDARVAHGFQFVLGDEASAMKLLSEITNLRDRMERLNAMSEADIEDCSLELSAVSVRAGARSALRYALLVRPCAAEDIDGAALLESTRALKSGIASFLSALNVAFTQTDDDTAVLPCYPVWVRQSASQFSIGVARKRTRRIDVGGRPTLWCPDLDAGAALDVKALLKALRAHRDCGMSLEIHGVPRGFQEKLAAMSSQAEGFGDWQSAVVEGDAMMARLAAWGDRAFVDVAGRALKAQLGADVFFPAFDNALAHCLVFDPWAFSQVVTDASKRLGAGQYILRRGEAAALLKPTSEYEIARERPVEQSASPAGLTPAPVIGQTEGAGDVNAVLPMLQTAVQDALEQSVMPELRGFHDRIDQIEAETQQANARLSEWLERVQRRFTDNTDELMQLSRRMSGISELVDRYDRLATGGLAVAFTQRELKCLGVQNEDELAAVLGLGEETVHLMRTAFSFARAGMLADATSTAIMPFFFPLGSLYEHLMRLYFKPALFDHSPGKREWAARQTQGKMYLDLREFDKISHAQIDAYADHAVIGGERYDRTYWIVWINILKSIRYIRNKAHTENGRGTLQELTLLYELMLKAGAGPKRAVLNYIFDLHDAEKRLYLLEMRFRDCLDGIEAHRAWYEPSVIDFILRCRDAQWVEGADGEEGTGV